MVIYSRPSGYFLSNRKNNRPKGLGFCRESSTHRELFVNDLTSRSTDYVSVGISGPTSSRPKTRRVRRFDGWAVVEGTLRNVDKKGDESLRRGPVTHRPNRSKENRVSVVVKGFVRKRQVGLRTSGVGSKVVYWIKFERRMV